MTGFEIRTTFAGLALDRRGELRTDQQQLEAALADPATRFVAVWRQRCLVERGAAALLSRDLLGPDRINAAGTVFLGEQAGRYLFALQLTDDEADLGPGLEFLELREVMGALPGPDAALVGYARAMLVWRERHAWCGVCGAQNEPREGGFVMACSSATCGHRSFPRLDPAIIVLVHQEDRCLLGRQPSWPEGRFSTIAGFVEPGESLEDAVRREVREETNIEVEGCHYLASQPWPFPAALMIGFHAQAVSSEIRCNDRELAEARWLTREQIINREVILPPPTSVAFRLIEAWFNLREGPGLAELGLAGPALRLQQPVESS